MIGWFWLSTASAGDTGAWEGLFLQTPLHGEDELGARLWMDLHARRDGGKFTGILRPAIGIDVAQNLSLYLGYAWVGSAVPEEGLASEHRIWHQLLWSASYNPLSFTLRPRLEERFAAGSSDVGLRARLFTRFSVGIRDPLALVLWDEPFWAINGSDFLPAGFDQNRLFFGPALSLSHDVGRFRLEMGYLDQRLLREGEVQSVSAIATNLFATF